MKEPLGHQERKPLKRSSNNFITVQLFLACQMIVKASKLSKGKRDGSQTPEIPNHQG